MTCCEDGTFGVAEISNNGFVYGADPFRLEPLLARASKTARIRSAPSSQRREV